MTRRKGNPMFKPIRSFYPSKRGIQNRTVYVKNPNIYHFKTLDGSRLSVNAHSMKEAKKEALSWQGWVRKKGFKKQKVLTSTGKLIHRRQKVK